MENPKIGLIIANGVFIGAMMAGAYGFAQVFKERSGQQR